ncbi:MAG: UDP-N-acetylglucosamine pyrophosphorylase [Candidatus Kapabacteria bacterium]|nr:UDP-N-acetylglucosamine pyrophosphorylase [Candidatus Kapabacteria bacterium]
MSDARQLVVAILAAGKGKRMGNPDLAKVLTPLDGRPLLGYVLDQASALSPTAVVVIVGHQADAVRAFVTEAMPSADTATQSEQLGTGHAVMQTRPAIGDLDADVLILSGDVPLVRASTLADLVASHRTAVADCTVLTTSIPDPTGYGRVRTNADGTIDRIVEHKDASDAERAITEINSGIYVVNSRLLFDALDRVRNDNAQAEYYLTDIVHILRADGRCVRHYHTADHTEVLGINTPTELGVAHDILEQRRTAP